MPMAMALLLAAQATAPAPPDPALTAIADRGRLIYAYDQAAWHGTDDLFAHHKDAQPKRGGYVVDGPVEAPRLVFYDAESHRAVYIAHIVGGRATDAIIPTGAEAELSPLDRRLIAAREAAAVAVRADATARPCADKPFNTVVIPPATPDGPVGVYLLTPQTTNEAIPLGGHYEVDVDAAGKPGPVRRFTHACLPTPTHPPAAPAGGKPVGVVVSQVIGDRPTEIHVFSSLTLRQPIYVITGTDQARMLWTVAGTHIGGPRPIPARAP